MEFAGTVVGGKYLLVSEVERGWIATPVAFLGVDAAAVRIRKVAGVAADDGPAVAAMTAWFARASGVEHLYVAPVLDLVRDLDDYWIVSEFSDRPTLAGEVRHAGRMAGADVADMGAQLVEALLATAAAGVAVDLQPVNVVRDPVSREVRLDLGMAPERHLRAALPAASFPSAPVLGYVNLDDAPGGDDVESLFSLGVTLFYALEGSLPGRDTLAQPERTYILEHGDLGQIIAMLLRADPARRPSLAILGGFLRSLGYGPSLYPANDPDTTTQPDPTDGAVPRAADPSANDGGLPAGFDGLSRAFPRVSPPPGAVSPPLSRRPPSAPAPGATPTDASTDDWLADDWLADLPPAPSARRPPSPDGPPPAGPAHPSPAEPSAPQPAAPAPQPAAEAPQPAVPPPPPAVRPQQPAVPGSAPPPWPAAPVPVMPVPVMPAPAAPSGPPPPMAGAPAGAGPLRRRGGSAGASQRPARAAGRDDTTRRAPSRVERAVTRTLRQGLLSFAAPDSMRQGRKERIEVGIAREENDRAALDQGFRTSGPRVTDTVQTADYMTVELVGDAFAILPLSPSTQVVAPAAHWEFDVTPMKSGARTLTLKGTSLISIDGGERAVAVPSFDRTIKVDVDVMYGLRQFTGTNWQWILGTVVALGGAIAGWISLF